jgi:hypothetical protein
MTFLCHTESDNQLHGGDLDVEDGGALFVKKFTRTEGVFMSNIALSLQPQSCSTLNRVKSLLTDPGLATRPAACAKQSNINTLESLFDFRGGGGGGRVFHTFNNHFKPVLRIRIHMFLGLHDPDPDPLVSVIDPDPDPALDLNPDPSIIIQI